MSGQAGHQCTHYAGNGQCGALAGVHYQGDTTFSIAPVPHPHRPPRVDLRESAVIAFLTTIVMLMNVAIAGDGPVGKLQFLLLGFSPSLWCCGCGSPGFPDVPAGQPLTGTVFNRIPLRS